MGRGTSKASKAKAFRVASKAASKTITQKVGNNNKAVHFYQHVYHSPTYNGKTETPINGVCRDDPTASCTMGHSRTHTLFDDEMVSTFSNKDDPKLAKAEAIELGELDENTGNLKNLDYREDVIENTENNGKFTRKPKITKKIPLREIRIRAKSLNPAGSNTARGKFKRKTRKRI